MATALSIFFIAALAKQSAADTLEVPSNEFGEDDESYASVKNAPFIEGDPESQRRTWIRKAWEARYDKKLRDESERHKQIEAYLRAADRIRSSTFTRCNLGLVAEAREDFVGAAEYFARELSFKLPPDASERVKFIRHLCETSSALAFERVGALQIVAPEHSSVWLNRYCLGDAPLVGSVFVKPDEEQVVRVEIEGEDEQRKTVAVRAGRTTTLKFYSHKKEEQPKAGLPPVPQPAPLVRNVPPSDTWKYVTAGSIALGGAGVVFVGIGTVMHGRVQSELRETTAENGMRCSSALGRPGGESCDVILVKHDIANAWSYAGLGLLGTAAAGGILSYVLKPKDNAPAVSLRLSPNHVQVEGAF